MFDGTGKGPQKARVCGPDGVFSVCRIRTHGARWAIQPGAGAGAGGDPAPRVGVFGFVSVTPPYEEVDYGVLLQQLVDSPLVGEGTFVGVEYPVELRTLPPVIVGAGGRLVGVRNRRYGRTLMALYVWGGGEGDGARPDEFRA